MIPFYIIYIKSHEIYKPNTTKSPKLDSVLDCLLTDSIGVDGVIFEDFCSEFGYNKDSIKAKKVYEACKKNSKKLKNLLGSTYFELIKCERL